MAARIALEGCEACWWWGGKVDDSGLDRLRDDLAWASGDFIYHLAVDLSGITLLPSTALTVLAHARTNAAHLATSLTITAARGSIAARVLEVTAFPHEAF